MTEKRFKFIRDSVARNLKTPLCDNDGQSLTLGEVLDKMNELHEENGQLKQYVQSSKKFTKEVEDFFQKCGIDTVNFRVLEELIDADNFIYEKYLKLEEENEQLKSICQDHRDHAIDFKADCVRLEKENEQLKETIRELRTIDKEKDIEVEHINNIYNAFGFKGLMDYAKDKLYNYGAVREVDTGLWLLATGGWSDNEFWLDCLLEWNFMYGKGHYRATTSGGGYYYSEKPYADISIMLNNTKGDD